MGAYDLIYTSDDAKNWFYEKYYYSGSNSRYWTFQAALNLLHQLAPNEPVILETGCQRQKEDIGAGMSTSIFGEYVTRYGGNVITVDNYQPHLEICKQCTLDWTDKIQYIEADSVQFLKDYNDKIDLLYLDSLDYPVGEFEGNIEMQEAAQTHHLNEFLAIEENLCENCILLLDDNQVSAGGKPRKLKEYLITSGEWVCILDFQQSLWIK